MRHFLLRQDAREDHWQAVFTHDVSLDDVRAGLPMDAPGRPARLTIASAAGVPSDFIEFPCPFVSDAMRRALDGAGVDNVQYFPALVDAQYVEGEVVAEYWVANVVGTVACAQPLPPPAGLAAGEAPPSTFRVDPARARGFDLFRLAENRRLLVVSERVADALRSAGLRGLVLQRPEEYTGRQVSTAPLEPVPDAFAAPPRGPLHP